MTTPLAERDESTSATALTVLAEHLRDGPLQRLIELQRRTQELGAHPPHDPNERLTDLAELLRLALSAMDQFHTFTREFQSLVQDLSDGAKLHH